MTVWDHFYVCKTGSVLCFICSCVKRTLGNVEDSETCRCEYLRDVNSYCEHNLPVPFVPFTL